MQHGTVYNAVKVKPFLLTARYSGPEALEGTAAWEGEVEEGAVDRKTRWSSRQALPLVLSRG